MDVPAAEAPKSPPARVALIIGNANYLRAPKLSNAGNDATDICTAVKALGFETKCYVDVVTRRQFRDLIQEFASALKPKSTALFYYAGHGVQISGENYLLPTDIDARVAADIEYEGINLAYILRTLEDVRSAPNIVILDACRDDPFSRSGSSRNLPGLARIDPPIGTILVYATAPNKVALDGQNRNGLFTKHLLANVKRTGITLDELFQAVAEGVEEEAKRVYRTQQVPYRSSSYSLRYCLAGCDDGQQLSAQLEEVRRQAEAARRRIGELSEENARLQGDRERRDAQISTLESRIGALSKQVSAAGVASSQDGAELARLRSELSEQRAAKREADRLQREKQTTDSEIVQLRARLATLEDQARQLDEYRRQIKALEEANSRIQQNTNRSPNEQNKPSNPRVLIPSY